MMAIRIAFDHLRVDKFLDRASRTNAVPSNGEIDVIHTAVDRPLHVSGRSVSGIGTGTLSFLFVTGSGTVSTSETKEKFVIGCILPSS